MAKLHGIEILEKDEGGRTIRTLSTSVIGIIGTAPAAEANKFPINTPILINNINDTKGLGEVGTLPASIKAIYQQVVTPVVIVRIEDGADINATINNAAGNELSYTGVYALLRSEELVRVKPKILICPFLDSKVLATNKPNAVTNNLLQLAERLRAVAIINGPNTTKADALAYAANLNNQRGYMIDPSYIPSFVNPSPNPTALSSSPLVAGVLARSDTENGFWYSPSNQIINGILKLNRPVSSGITDKNSDANLLNQGKVATIVFRKGSYKLWGNRSLGTDEKWSFLSVRRTADAVYEALEYYLDWAIDKPFSKVLISTVENNIQTFLNSLKAKGAILGGEVWFDKNINSKEELANGHATISLDFEPPAPMEQLSLEAHRNVGYYDELFK